MYNFYGNNLFRLEKRGHVDPDDLCDEIEKGIYGTKGTSGALDLTVKSKLGRHWIVLHGDQKGINMFVEAYRILN